MTRQNPARKAFQVNRTKHPLLSKVQVNIPFTMLVDTYLKLFIEYQINPEIGFDAEALDRFSFSDFKTISKEITGCGLKVTIHGPFMDLSPGSPDARIRRITLDRYQQLLDIVPLFKPKSVVCHAGYEILRYGYLKEKWFHTSIKSLRWLAEQCRELGTRLMLENVYEDGPEQMELLFKALKDFDVGFCFDTGHQLAFSRTSLGHWITLLGGYLGQLHLHDNHGKMDEHSALGKGDVDFTKLFTMLKTTGTPRPLVTLEPHEEKDLWPSLDFLEQHWIWE